MKVYMDISSFAEVKFLTGIQRVVKEFALHLLQTEQLELVLLGCNEQELCFYRADSKEFLSLYREENADNKKLCFKRKLEISDIESGSIFFDVDGVWNSRLRRSYLLPRLKEHGVKLVVFIHDIIPVTFPQFSHQDTTLRFMDYLGAYLKYADMILTSTNTTKDTIQSLIQKLGVQEIPCAVTSLGADFKKETGAKEEVGQDMIQVCEKNRYILMVGTIEPRKNHKLVIDAFEQILFEKDLNLIIAGRIGWNSEDMEHRIKEHSMLGKKMFYFDKASDAEIDYMYRHAYFTAFPTYDEGFGLPLIESIQRGTPVLASNCKVLQEIGKDYCDYFASDSVEEFANLVIGYLDNKEKYQRMKNQLADYQADTWEQVTKVVEENLLSIDY